MRSHQLRRIFRNVLALGLLPSASIAACGGVAIEVEDSDAGSTQDAAVTPTKPPTTGRDSGTTKVDASVVTFDGGKDASVVKKDASVLDGAIKDTGVDGCVSTPAPLPDFDGSFPPCEWQVPLPCSVDTSQGIPQTECQQYCGPQAFYCYPHDPSAIGGGDGGAESGWVLLCGACAIGRRPEGFAIADQQASAANDACVPQRVVGQFFAMAAELEAASVFSFERLERELAAHGAPKSLQRRARRAAQDERRHARVTRVLAERFGGAPATPSEGPRDIRDLEAIALENAIEGCVRETFGALTATVQAERSSDRRVRAAMRRIAADETEHAALAWSVASWISTRLSPESQAEVRAAMQATIEALASDVSKTPPALLQDVCGLPSGREAAGLVDEMRAALWAA